MKKALLEEHVRYGEARFRDKELVRPFVNRIYQDLAELESTKQRTCDSCKHIRIKQFRNNEVATCTNDKCNEMCDCEVGNDFCCNKFELKDDE